MTDLWTTYLKLRAKLPMGEQNFADLRAAKKIYVDKTDFIFNLAQDNIPKFLSRPRRFGKSTIVSTLEELFTHGVKSYDGHDSFFKGLKIEKLWHDEGQYKVLHLDFYSLVYFCKNVAEFENSLNQALDSFAEKNGLNLQVKENEFVSSKFERLVSLCVRNSLVFLLDEYDAPLAKFMTEGKGEEYNRIIQILQGISNTIKLKQGKFRCVFITGITRYKHSSIFTAGGTIMDISLQRAFGECCGYTRSEILEYFKEYLRYAVAYRRHLALEDVTSDDLEQILDEMALFYNGYCFDLNAKTKVFSTWSVLSFFSQDDASFLNYWYGSGGLPSLLRNSFFKGDIVQTLSQMVNGELSVSISEFLNPTTLFDMNRKVLLYQTGYLTLASPIRIEMQNTDVEKVYLKFPNRELEWSFKNLLFELIFVKSSEVFSSFSQDKFTLLKKIMETQDLGLLVDFFNHVLKSVDYEHYPIKEESMFTAILASFLYGMGLNVKVNAHQSGGRDDLSLTYENCFLVLENKFIKESNDKQAQKLLDKAVEQIADHDYGKTADCIGKSLWQVALVFSQNKKQIVKAQDRILKINLGA